MEKNDDGSYPDGYETELITGKMGKRAVWQPDVRLRDVRVPAANKLAGAQLVQGRQHACSPRPAAAPRGSAWATRWRRTRRR